MKDELLGESALVAWVVREFTGKINEEKLRKNSIKGRGMRLTVSG